MAAPTVSHRGVPAGRKIPEGYQAFVTFGSKPTIGFWEVEVDPPEVDGGEPIKTTTQHNTTYHVKYPQHLKEFGPSEGTAAYDPDVITDILSLINVPDSVTWQHPDGSLETHWAYLQKFKRQKLKIGEFPMADFTIVIMDQDASLNEQGPVFNLASGT